MAQTLTVGSYNIRYDNSGDRRKGNDWQRRCLSICQLIRWECPDVFGAQEVLHDQLQDLEAGLEGYQWIGVGRDDGQQAGEYAPIFYRSARLELLQQGHFWLNETPDRPAIGWDAACVRICTWARFRDLQTDKEFLFLNLHMDHVGVRARRESALLVMQRVQEMTGGAVPVVLTGDFNVSQEDELYALFTAAGFLRDSYASAQERWAENGTFNSFKSDRFTRDRIDHIFVTSTVQVEAYAVRTDSYWRQEEDGSFTRRCLSDHYPIFARIQM